MVDSIAEKSTDEKKDQEKSTDEIAQDLAAKELLKEVDDAGKDDADQTKDKVEADEEPGDTQTKSGETLDTDQDSAGTDSQPEAAQKGKRGFKRRQARLVKQREDALAEKDDVSNKLRTSEEEKKLLRMKIDQLEGRIQPKEPNPDDFDGGDIDPEFTKAKRVFDDARIERMVDDKVRLAQKEGGQVATQQQNIRALEEKQKKHWEEADALGTKDYDEKEENLIKSIGAEMVSDIITYFPGESAPLIYFLGTNREEAEKIGDLLEDKATLVRGVAQLGRILERIKIKDPKQSTNPADPDTETEGSAPSAQESLQAHLEKLRDQAGKEGNKDGMKKIIAFKKKAEERGITLR